MNKKLLNYSSVLITLPVLLLPVVARAQISFKFNSFIAPTSISSLLSTILTVLITLATPIVVLFIIYSGFLYVTARGNTQQVQQATRSLTYAVIGGILIIGAVALGQMLDNVVSSFMSP